jgi:hypothetical protein
MKKRPEIETEINVRQPKMTRDDAR